MWRRGSLDDILKISAGLRLPFTDIFPGCLSPGQEVTVTHSRTSRWWNGVGPEDAHQKNKDSDAIVWKPQNLCMFLKGIWFGFTGKLPGSLFSRGREFMLVLR